MGFPLSPVIADIVMQDLEESVGEFQVRDAFLLQICGQFSYSRSNGGN